MCFEMTKVRIFKDSEKNVQIEFKKYAISMNHFGQNFNFFIGCYFLKIFGWN